jgi:uroporphyrinogen-III synthase
VRVLIVRPAPGNAATADAVAAMGFEAVVVPLFEVLPLAWEVPAPSWFDAVVMTSANAARLAGAGLTAFTHLPLFAVGEATAAAARNAGFGDVRAGASDAAELGQHLSGNVLHLTGTDYRPIPTEAEVTVTPVYEAWPIAPCGPLRADVALIHSPQAGRHLGALIPDRNATTIVAISSAAALACGFGWAAIHTAERPREHAMLECLARVCKAPSRN